MLNPVDLRGPTEWPHLRSVWAHLLAPLSEVVVQAVPTRVVVVLAALKRAVMAVPKQAEISVAVQLQLAAKKQDQPMLAVHMAWVPTALLAW